MGRETKIEWCDHTFNPWRGCSEESEGCRNCYARQWARRNPGQFGVWGENGYRAFGLTKAWKEPLRWNRQAEKDGVRRRVFCGSMMDLFERLPREHPQALELVEARVRLFNLAQDCSHLDWLFLTKRPVNAATMQPERWRYGWPKNCFIGTSIENQDTLWRINELLKIPARRFISAEPLLESVDFGLRNWNGLEPRSTHPLDVHWLIVGGESGPRARPCGIEWIRSIIDDCGAALVPVFVKQLGANVEASLSRGSREHYARVHLRDPKGGDPEEWPADLRVREFPRDACRA